MQPRLVIIALLLSAAPGPVAHAQEAPAPAAASLFGRKYPPRIYSALRLEGKPPVVDGRFDDEAWQQGEWAGSYRQNMPVEGALPSQKTELKILYDDRHVYVAIRAYDDPAKVNRYPGRRDDFQEYAVDVVGVCFDSYNDKRTGFEFDLTAGGGKIDLILGNGETEWDTTWDAVWEGKVAHDEKGWTAEFGIPLNQLRFGRQDEQVWGMHAWRWIARNQEEDQWQLIPRQNSGRMYQLGELRGIRGLPRSRHLELLPYTLGRTASGPSVPGQGRDSSAGMGLDAKVGLTTNFTLDGTVNPDFGQVEADPSVVNLSAYETFYEEKRPFFLEGRKILRFEVEDEDQLFYSRRVGQPPSLVPTANEGETLNLPQNTTILGAAKVTGKTNDGLSVALLQSFTQRENAELSSARGTVNPVVEPFGSYTVARVQKDFDKGNTIVGGMLTSTHRALDGDPTLAFLPRQAWSGGVDFTRYFGDRDWLVEGNVLFSQVSGDRQAIRALQTNPVHFYQRPGASHLGLDENATSLSGHGGFVRAGTSGKGRFRLTDHFHWYSPGLDLNDVGYLRQADLVANQVFVGWSEPTPKGIFRDYSFQVSREDHWDFGGLQTKASTGLDASGSFENKWGAAASISFQQDVDTRALRGGPALRTHDYFESSLQAHTDGSRRASFSLHGEHAWSLDDDSRKTSLELEAGLRPSRRLSLSAEVGHEKLADNLQYVASAVSGDGPRWVLGRIDQDTWSFTVRANLTLTPELTLQYYGSPFVSAGRYTQLKRASDTLSRRYDERFLHYAPGEIGPSADGGSYSVAETGGASYSFANPDFSFRQFRSNLVARWEYRPGSSLYVVWSQGRTGYDQAWQDSFSSNWRGLWDAPPDDVFMVKFSYWFSP